MALRIFATASGSALPSVFTRMPRSAPMARAVRIVSAACAGPIETATISVALPASLSRSASSTAISSKGFIDILTLASSTPEPSDLTRIFTSLSTARLTGTRIFMACFDLSRSLRAGSAALGARRCCGAGTYRRARLRSTPRAGAEPAKGATRRQTGRRMLKRTEKPAINREGGSAGAGWLAGIRHGRVFFGEPGMLERPSTFPEIAAAP